MKRKNKNETDRKSKNFLPGLTSESENCRPLTLEQIQERLNNTILASSLALKVLKGMRKPTSQLINELLEIEFQVGHFVGEAMKIHIQQMKRPNLRGTLANALSTVPLGNPRLNTSAPAKPQLRAKKKQKKKSAGRRI